MRAVARAALLGAAMLLPSGFLSHLASQETACSLITRADAARILSKPAIANAQVITDDEEDCGYLLAGFDLHTELLRSVPGWSSWRADLIRKGEAEAIEEIGDEAAFTKDGNGDYLIVARKGNRIVTVTMYASEGTPAEIRPKLIALSTAAMTKVH